jgi:hypothetical protein
MVKNADQSGELDSTQVERGLVMLGLSTEQRVMVALSLNIYIYTHTHTHISYIYTHTHIYNE